MLADLKIQAHLAEPCTNWPDPLPPNDELPAVLPFHPDLMPNQLGPWVQDIAERMNCPLEFVAIPAMVAAGSLTGQRIGKGQRLLHFGGHWRRHVNPHAENDQPSAAGRYHPAKFHQHLCRAIQVHRQHTFNRRHIGREPRRIHNLHHRPQRRRIRQPRYRAA